MLQASRQVESAAIPVSTIRWKQFLIRIPIATRIVYGFTGKTAQKKCQILLIAPQNNETFESECQNNKNMSFYFGLIVEMMWHSDSEQPVIWLY